MIQPIFRARLLTPMKPPATGSGGSRKPSQNLQGAQGLVPLAVQPDRFAATGTFNRPSPWSSV